MVWATRHAAKIMAKCMRTRTGTCVLQDPAWKPSTAQLLSSSLPAAGYPYTHNHATSCLRRKDQNLLLFRASSAEAVVDGRVATRRAADIRRDFKCGVTRQRTTNHPSLSPSSCCVYFSLYVARTCPDRQLLAVLEEGGGVLWASWVSKSFSATAVEEVVPIACATTTSADAGIGSWQPATRVGTADWGHKHQ